MQQFLQILAGEGPTDDVVDLCLDHPLIAEEQPGRFSQVGGLEAFPALESLSIAQHELIHLKGLPTFAALQELNLSQNELESLAGFSPQPLLKTLDLTLNNLTNLEGFPDLPLLEELHLSHNHLQTLSPWPALPRLRELNLSGNKLVRNISPLASQNQLQTLTAWRLPVQDWSFLQDLPQLTSLHLSPHQPDFHLALSPHHQIRTLGWEIRQLEPRLTLPPLPLLKKLELKNGKNVSEIKGWEKLPALEYLHLDRLSEEAWLSLELLPQLHTLVLKNTSLPAGLPWHKLPRLKTIRMKQTNMKDGAMQALHTFNPAVEIEVF